MKTTEEQLKVISDKLQLLVKKFAAMNKENISLTTELDKIKLREKDFQKKFSYLEMETSILKASAGKMDDKEKTTFEKQINQYIKDLERCMTMLNK